MVIFVLVINIKYHDVSIDALKICFVFCYVQKKIEKQKNLIFLELKLNFSHLCWLYSR